YTPLFRSIPLCSISIYKTSVQTVFVSCPMAEFMEYGGIVFIRCIELLTERHGNTVTEWAIKCSVARSVGYVRSRSLNEIFCPFDRIPLELFYIGFNQRFDTIDLLRIEHPSGCNDRSVQPYLNLYGFSSFVQNWFALLVFFWHQLVQFDILDKGSLFTFPHLQAFFRCLLKGHPSGVFTIGHQEGENIYPFIAVSRCGIVWHFKGRAVVIPRLLPRCCTLFEFLDDICGYYFMQGF